MELPMNRVWMAGFATVALLAGSSVAMSQDEDQPMAGTTTKTTTTTTWTVRPEERTVIHNYVVKEKIPSETVKEEVVVGAPVPTDVELQPVPEEIYTSVPETRRYEYFDWNGRMVFVDPDSRKVVQIID